MTLATKIAARLQSRRPDLARALREIEAQHGPDMQAWQRKAHANFARLLSEAKRVEQDGVVGLEVT